MDLVQPKETILLHVVSPSSEVPDRLTFPAVATSSTILDLKRMIQNAVSTNPAPERQRLIYRGRALNHDNAILKTIIDRETIERAESTTIHLVIPPLPGPISSTASTASSTPYTANGVPTHLQSGRASILPQVPQRPASTGQLHGGLGFPTPFSEPAHAGHRGLPGQYPPWSNLPPIPPQMQEQLNNHLASSMGQLLGHNPLPTSSSDSAHNGSAAAHLTEQQRPFPDFSTHPLFQQHLRQQQLARAAAGQHGIGTTTSNHGPNGHTTTTPLAQLEAGPLLNHASRTNSPGNSTTIVQEGQGPNGAQWRMVINQSTATIPLQLGTSHINAPQHPTASTSPTPVRFPVHGANSGHHFQAMGVGMPQIRRSPLLGQGSEPHSPSHLLAALQQRLSMLEMAVENGGHPQDIDFLQTRVQLTELLRHQPHQANLASALNARLDNLAMRAAHNRIHNANHARQTANSHMNGSPAEAQSSSSYMVYLLSSPAGPHALLCSPTGMYSSLGLGAQSMSANASTTVHHQQDNTPPGQAPMIVNAANVPPAAAQDGQNVQQQHQPDQARDILNILLPVGGQLWLLIRLIGFVYFFTTDAGWYRTVVLSIGAFIVFLAQIGIFGPLRQAVWEPFRSHMEGLLFNILGVDVNGNRPVRPDQQPAGAQPNPQELAQRLIQERNEQEQSLFSRNLRRAERAVALFIASLVPGVGEQHIAARDAAEAVRLAEEREREERVRREEEESRQANESISGEEHASENFADAEEGTRPDEQAPQPPLIEI